MIKLMLSNRINRNIIQLLCVVAITLAAARAAVAGSDEKQENSLFKVDRVPFSTFGAWTSISIPRDETELFFRNHHGKGADLFPLRTLVDGKVVTPEIIATPWLLTLKTDQGQVEICYERPGTVRMRGQGVGFQMGKRNLIYNIGPRLLTFNMPFSRRYQVEVLHGSASLRQLVATQPVFPKVALIAPAEDGRWEIAIDAYDSTWVRPDRAEFDECVKSAKEAFTRFLNAMPDVRPQDRHSQRLATYVVWTSTVQPRGLVKRHSLLMSKNWMNRIWSWDHCFNAMALAKGHPKLAVDQMLTMVDLQDEFGSYPDSFNDLELTYNFSKPPVHGLAFREVLRRMPEKPSSAAMQMIYASLAKQTNWWMKHRRLKDQRLPHYLHGNDSGWDNSSMFKKGVPLVAPDLAALLIVQMDVLAELASELGKDDERDQWKKRANALQQALVEELWRDDRFVARLANDGSYVESQSLIPWLPIILGQRLPAEMRVALKNGIEGHLTKWGLSTEKLGSPFYRKDGYWKGSIWAPSTFIAVTGLERSGFKDLANTIANRFCTMCGSSGFPENFNAETGEPLRCPAYTWTASVFLLFAENMNRN